MSEQKGLSRRKFLVGTGLATGALAAAGAGLIKPGTAEAAYTALPWPLATLNVSTVRQRAYNNYYVSGCMYATGSALVTTLAETVGAPWDSIPPAMFNYGAGGVASWGTLCGALNGACYVLQLAGGTMADKAIDELLGWYCNFQFPSTAMDSYAQFTRQRTSVSHNPLCHASASNWAYSAKKTINSAERKDRCAKLAGDVAAKTVELLNAIKAGTFTPTYVQPNASCVSCHVGPTSTYDNAVNKSSCTSYCHVPGKKGGDMPTH